jgi:MoaA/NifB/PqqE/SkfB family radical SAM enzyme
MSGGCHLPGGKNEAMNYRQILGDRLEDMDEETFGLLLEQMRALPELRKVTIGGYGEPFTHPRIMAMLEGIRALGVKVTASTNGLLIGGRAEKLVGLVEDYVRFRAQVRNFRFPSCVDCDIGDTCDVRESNEGCWGWNPSCADCL